MVHTGELERIRQAREAEGRRPCRIPCVDARLEKAAKGCPELDAALQVWKDITFDFESTDTPDVLVTPSVGY